MTAAPIALRAVHDAPVLVWVLAPLVETTDPDIAWYSDHAQGRAEYERAFAALGFAWRWQDVTLSNHRAVIASIVRKSAGHQPVIFNLCDGDEVNGAPGVSIIRCLKEHGLRFTGADEQFYDATTSKIAMKEAFDRDGVPTAPWAVLRRDGTDAAAAVERLGTPLILKPAVSAGSMGITTKLDPVLPLALGASGVRPLDLCSAYSAFANSGDRYEPAFVQSITDASGRDVFQDDPTTRLHRTVLNQSALDQINIGLREVVVNGTAPAAASIPDAHGKTGTTSSHRDAWFVGYTGDLAVAVWTAHVHKETVQHSAGSAVLNHYLPMGSATGGAVCAPIWRDFMVRALPEQHRIQAALSISSGPLSVPDKETLLAALRQRAQDENALQASASPSAGAPQTEIAANSSAPEPYTGPSEAEEQASADAVRIETPAPSGDQNEQDASPQP